MVEVRRTDVFLAWLEGLKDRAARARTHPLLGPSAVKPVGQGVSEMRIDYGPGYGCISSSAAKR